MAAHFRLRLELPIDTAVALFDAAGIPWKVEVEEVRAMRLKVQALASGVRCEEDAEWIFRRIGIEPPLDLLPMRAAREAIDDLNALISAVGSFDCLLEDRLQVSL